MTTTSQQEMLQELTLTVPVDYQLPAIFSIGDSVAIAKILTLGAEAYELIYTRGAELRNASEFDVLKKQAEQQYLPRLQQLEAQTKDATTTIEQQQKRIQQDATDRLELEQRIREEERRNREEILKEKDKVIDTMKKLNEDFQQSQKAIVSEFHTMKDQIIRTTTTSKTKGNLGEFIFTDYLRKAFGGVGLREHFNIESKGKEAHMGDIHLEVRDVKSLWEVKNYEYPVPKKEDDKFLKDMETNPHMQYGVLTSLYTKIQNHSNVGSIDLQFLADGRFVLYISEFLSHDDPLMYLFSLKPMIEGLCEITHMLRTQKAEQEDVSEDDVLVRRLEQLQQNRKRILAALQEAEKRSKEFYTQFKKAKKNFDEQWFQLEEALRPSKDSITNILKAYESVSDMEDEDVVQPSKVHSPIENRSELKGHIFTKTDILLYSQDEHLFIKTLLKYLQQEDTEETIQKKDFKALLEAHTGFSSDKLDRMCKATLTDQCWGKGQKVKYFTKKPTTT
jgi:hypothetical protein